MKYAGKYIFSMPTPSGERESTLLLRNYFDGTYLGTLKDSHGNTNIITDFAETDKGFTFKSPLGPSSGEFDFTSDGKSFSGSVAVAQGDDPAKVSEFSGVVAEITPEDDGMNRVTHKFKALIMYATITKNTEKIAKCFKESFEHYGWEVDFRRITNTQKDGPLPASYNDYDVVCLGSNIIAGSPMNCVIKQFSLGGGTDLEANVTKNAEAGLGFNAGGVGLKGGPEGAGGPGGPGGGMPPMGAGGPGGPGGGMPPMGAGGPGGPGGGMPPMGEGGPGGGMPPMGEGGPGGPGGGMPPMGEGGPGGPGGDAPGGQGDGGLLYAGGPAPHGVYHPIGVVFCTYGGGFYGSHEADATLELLKLYLELKNCKVIGKFCCCGKEFGPAGIDDGVKPNLMGPGTIDDPVYYKDADGNYHAGSYFFHTHMNSKPNERDFAKARALICDLVEDYFYSYDGIRKDVASEYISIS